MCELMGMSFAKSVVASVSIQAFSERSKDNADGWGLAWYPDRSLAMIKQPVRWSLEHTQFLEHYPGLLSSTYIAHVRQKTTGHTPTHADTHPFSRELNGREYCFAHNGTLTGEFWQRPLGRFRPMGGTDSEFMFCLLLAELENFAHLADEVEKEPWGSAFQPGHSAKPEQGQAGKPGHTNGKNRPRVHHVAQSGLDAEQLWRWLHQFLLRLNDFGKLNCILTDGSRMLVYHDKNGWKNLTYHNIYLHENAMHHFADAQVAVNLQGQPVNHGIIVATNPLSVNGWERFLPGELKVLHEGNIVFTERRGLNDAKSNGKKSTSAPVSGSPVKAEKANAKVDVATGT